MNMEKVQMSQALLRKRKMLLVLPLLVVPFLTMAFWGLGGGRTYEKSKATKVSQGLNVSLPNAHLKDDRLEDKLSFYDQADKDSAKKAEWMRSDPYYKDISNEMMFHENSILNPEANSKYKEFLNPSPYTGAKRDRSQEIMQKVALLQKELDKPQSPTSDAATKNNANVDEQDSQFGNDVNRLESMVAVMNTPDSPDHEIKKLDGMLDKILDIQHPERVSGRIQQKSNENKTSVYSVTRQPIVTTISLLDTSKQKPDLPYGFFGIEEDAIAIEQNSIEAVIHESRTLFSGSVIKLRLVVDVYVNGSLIPKGNFLFGIASLQGERLTIEINSIKSGNSIYPVKLEVYDFDGLPGIYIPGAITRDVAKQSAVNSLQQVELNSMDESLKVQAATSGINTAKNLLTKKINLVKVTVKAGYKILLKDKTS